uniref:Rab-GAP TBC domain-containing protein n=1 Tax=Globisporangium ultimum (strain ATCC 200006 / CBS 805.95 / DAOM BR144) TaxID=431595 RepID=K3XAE1_GLOUD
MDVPWRQLKDEAKRLALEIGASGREHHSLVKNAAALAAIRAQGVPPEHREWVWPILLHQQNQKLQRQSSDFATYNQLLHSDDGHADEQETQDSKQQPLQQDSSSFQQAQELAMERFSHLNPFQERKIKRILVAYTKSKDVFYYCHGMVEICVVLSTFLEEEDAFWAFRLLLEALLPKYHEESIVDFHTDCLVLQELLNNYDPILCEHFSTMGVTIQLLCTKWFFSFFAESMPFELVCRLYDVLLVDICCLRLSSKIIFSTSMAVFLYLSATLAEVHDPSVIVEIIYEFCWTTLSDYSVAETFVDLILFLHDQLEDDDIVELRRKGKC